MIDKRIAIYLNDLLRDVSFWLENRTREEIKERRKLRDQGLPIILSLSIGIITVLILYNIVSFVMN